MIACIGVGLPLLAAAMHNKTHQEMVHAIKTRHGTLRPYSGTEAEPLIETGRVAVQALQFGQFTA
jgi:hypothetical protein